jgi:integrase
MNGSVRRRDDGWEYMFDAGLDPATGKRRRRSKSGFKTQRAATQAMRDAMRATELGVTAPGEVPTVAAFIDDWLAGRRPSLRDSTWESYRDTLTGRVVPRLGALRLDRVRPKHIAEMLSDLKERGGRNPHRGPGLSDKSVRYTLSTFATALSDAAKQGLIPRNPADHVDRPRAARKEMQWWSVDEARRFLDYVKDDRHVEMWTLALTTGMRGGELLGLKWPDIDFEAGRLAVRRTLVAVAYQIRCSEPKTAASRRVVALDPATLAVLRAHRAQQAEEKLAIGSGYLDQQLVFADVAGEPLHPDAVTKHFDRLVARAGVPKIRLHDLRHTAATLMLEQGIPLKAVTERLGHSSTQITSDLYQHVGEHMQDDAAAKLGWALLGEH